MQLKLKDIEAGTTIYVACSEQKWVEEVFVCTRPVMFLLGGKEEWWIVALNPKFSKLDVRLVEADDHFRSLSDMGIVPNHYNRHLGFDNREEAEKYAGIWRCPTCGR